MGHKAVPPALPALWRSTPQGGLPMSKSDYYNDPLLLAHLYGGLRMAAGVTPFHCGDEN
ncbi:hypothetical protein Abr02nite_32620 [Paractinoplanes brasiliensis]|nr:hypothetical protein Abr02nite_32620 [Actinoplanes brasiliensis]